MAAIEQETPTRRPVPIRLPRLTTVAAAGVICGFLLLVLFAENIAPYGPFETVRGSSGALAVLEPPSSEFPLGTTSYSNDIFSQLVLGARSTLLVGVSAALAVGLISTAVGVVAGYFGGWVDGILMRFTDFMLSLPTLPLAIVLLGILGADLSNVILIIGLLYWRHGARIVRSAVLREKEKLYVKAAQSIGASTAHIIWRHILPNIFPVALLWTTMAIAFAILTEASLSFIGLGDPTVISWGKMLNVAFAAGAMRSAWWWVIPPSLCLVLLVSSIYILGRAHEERVNPRLRPQSGTSMARRSRGNPEASV